AQSKMILRKLEKLEAAYIEQAKRLKLAESDLQVMTMRTRALSAEVDRLRGGGTRLERPEDMVDQVIRAGGRRGRVALVAVEPPAGVAGRVGADPRACWAPGPGAMRAQIAVGLPVQGSGDGCRPCARPGHSRRERPSVALSDPPQAQDRGGVSGCEAGEAAQGRAQAPGRPAGRVVDW